SRTPARAAVRYAAPVAAAARAAPWPASQKRRRWGRAMNAGDIARRLGGEVTGRDTILCPGPGHSPNDRSLAVKLVLTAPDGFLIHSHAGDDWRLCRDHVRQRLGLPRWEPGDDQRRNIPPRHTDKWDLAAVGAEAEEGPRAWTEDEIVRIEN